MDTSFDKSTIKTEYLTPKYITDAIGPFDLDPCASIERPWDIAKTNYTRVDDGLTSIWNGFVFCNPPYGNNTIKWFSRLSEYNNGIILTFARIETAMFEWYVWPKASCIFVFYHRIRFLSSKGKEYGTPGAPSILIGYGELAKYRLSSCSLKGKYIQLK